MHPKIVAVKDATADAAHTTAVIAGATDDFAVYAGDDVNTLPIMALGGVGVVSVASHLVGRHIKAMIEAFRDGKVDDAAGINRRLAEVFRLLFVEPNPTPVKAALRLVGIDAGDPRLPLLPAQPSTIDALRDQLAELT
jgi:4-hydroxy-tetrahydrodipicolinate synthase